MNETMTPRPLSKDLEAHFSKKFLPLLKQWSQQDRIPHSLLITGGHGIGKGTCARWLAQIFQCDRSVFAEESLLPEPHPSFYPCGECKNCVRAQNNHWIDLELIQPDSTTTESKSHTIKVEQLRNLKTMQGRGPSESRFRITLILNAEHMTPQASNSLLKILEEPPENWIFILTTMDSSLLLPTIVSRCQTVRLPPLSHKTLLSLLSETELSESQKEILIKLSQGSLKKLNKMLENDFSKSRKLIQDFFITPEKHLHELIEWASKDPENITQLLDQLDLICMDFIKNIQKNHTNEFYKNGIQLFEHQQTARARLGLPLNKKLFIENLVSPWLKLLTQQTPAQRLEFY